MNLMAMVSFGGAAMIASSVFLQSGPPAASTIEGVRELIDNQRAFICELTLTKGQKLPMTAYEHDTLVVALTPASLAISGGDGTSHTLTLAVGDVRFWPKGTRQAAESASDARLIVAHVKDAASPVYTNTSGFGPAFPRPRAKKLLENERLAVWDYTWVEGQPTPAHFHDKDLMVVYLADGAIRSVTPDGTASPNEFRFAEVRFNTGNRAHYEEYLRGNGPRAIITELK